MNPSQAIKELLTETPFKNRKEMAERYSLVPLKCSECKAELTASKGSGGFSLICISRKQLCSMWHTVQGVLPSFNAIQEKNEKEMRYKY
jgi:hypothetical protein